MLALRRCNTTGAALRCAQLCLPFVIGRHTVVQMQPRCVRKARAARANTVPWWTVRGPAACYEGARVCAGERSPQGSAHLTGAQKLCPCMQSPVQWGARSRPLVGAAGGALPVRAARPPVPIWAAGLGRPAQTGCSAGLDDQPLGHVWCKEKRTSACKRGIGSTARACTASRGTAALPGSAAPAAAHGLPASSQRNNRHPARLQYSPRLCTYMHTLGGVRGKAAH